MKKKRILFISDSSKLGGGTNSYLLSLIKYLHNDFDCAVVSDKHCDQLPTALQEYKIPHFALHDRVALFFPSLLALILLGRYDLVYGNGANGRSLWAFRAAKLTGRPFIWHIHESIKRTSYARGLQIANAVIANSQDTAERIRELAHNSHPIVIPCGIVPNDFDLGGKSSREELGQKLDLNPDWFRVINIGRICHDKNQMDVLNVASQIIKKYPKTYFILIGVVVDPKYLDELKNEAQHLGLSQNVIFLNYTSNVSNYLSGSDLMLHTARNEPQGLVILEAMAARLPLVAYEVGGVGETIVQGETGYLRPFGDIEGLVKDLGQLLENPTLRSTFGNAGHLRVQKHFTAENTALKVKNIIDKVIGA